MRMTAALLYFVTSLLVKAQQPEKRQVTGQRQTVNCAPAKKQHETLSPVPFLMCAHLTTSLAAGSHVFLYQLHCPCTRLPGWSSSAPAWCSWSLRPQVWPQHHWHACRASAARPGLGLLKVLSELLSPIRACTFGGLCVSVWRGTLVSPPLPQQPLHSPRRAGQHLPQLGSVWLWHLSRLAVVSSSQPLFFPLAAAWPLLSSLCLAFGSSPRGCS